MKTPTLGQGVGASKTICKRGRTFAIVKVQFQTHTCNPSAECSGAYQIGKEAARYFRDYGGSELDLLHNLTVGLCRVCQSNFFAGFFIEKELMEEHNGI
ncbi:MAG: hypothetical protein WEA58_11440 [Balneolaceae bacterium]